MAFSGGLAIGPYVTSYRPMQEFMTVTVTTTNQELTTVTVATTLGTSTSSSTTHYTTSRVTSQTPTTVTGKWLGSSANVVSYLQAANYIGQSKTVEGTIVRTYVSSKGTVFLDFHDPYKGYFQVTIFSSDVKNFQFSPASFYLNKEVRVTGTIQLYEGAPEIIVHSPSQIEVAYMGFNYP
jgi:hypothetical protein